MELVTRTCKCGVVHRFGSTIDCVKCRCGEQVYGPCVPAARVVYIPPPESTSTLWTKIIKRFARSTDKGVGDTVQRIASWLGGEWFKAFAERIGMPCNCTNRQAEWNERWPY